MGDEMVDEMIDEMRDGKNNITFHFISVSQSTISSTIISK